MPVTRVRLAPAPLAGHLALGTPWVPLLAGCCAGTGLSLAMDFTARTQDPRLVATLVRASFVPVLAGLAFVLQDRHWLLSASLPVPGWIATAMRAGLVLPFLAVTCWLQQPDGADRLHALDGRVRQLAEFLGFDRLFLELVGQVGHPVDYSLAHR